MTVPAHSEKYDDLELAMLEYATQNGMTFEDACNQFDALKAGNDGAFTAPIQAIFKKFWLMFVEVNSK